MESIQNALTRTEMNEQIASAHERTESALRGLQQAEGRYRHATDRSGFASDEAHQIALRDGLPGLEAAEQTARRQADEIERGIREILRQTANVPITLDPDDAARASAILPLIEREVANTPLADLPARVRMAIADGSRPQQFLYTELLPARIKRDAPAPMSPEGRAAAELQHLVGQMRDNLRDRWYDPVRTRALGVLESTAQLRIAAEKRARDATPALTSDGLEKTPWPARS